MPDAAQKAIAEFVDSLRQGEDIKAATLRNYESDLRHFATWLETKWDEGGEPVCFSAEAVTTPTITQYRAYMQQVARLKPATINRRLVALKRYFRWAVEQELVSRSPAAPVRLVPMEPVAPRHLTDREESDLVAVVSAPGVPARDRALIITMLHTGLRAQEVCDLTLADIRLSKKDGWLTVQSGKRSKWREVPLNGTVRAALEEYISGLTGDCQYLFPGRGGGRLTLRALRLIVARHAQAAGVPDLSRTSCAIGLATAWLHPGLLYRFSPP